MILIEVPKRILPHRIYKIKKSAQQIDYRAHPALITIELGDKDVQGVSLKASQSE